MTIDIRTVAIVLAVLVSAPLAAQTKNPPGEPAAAKSSRTDRAKERCRLNHGVDCDTPDGLKQWLLLERSRKEAVLEGSRHQVPVPPKPAPSGR